MATDSRRRERFAWVVLAAVALVTCGAVAYSYLSRPPQMGPSEAVFETVDALYTAVRNRDEKRVTECETRFAAYRAGGELPAAAADTLAAVVRQARGGSWDAAAERLYRFMLAQRRDGATDSHPPRPAAGKAKVGKTRP
ncbi:hypothetical protein J0H58_10835 [bacterium]|nr:hypothetical protein [bacterium]